MRSILVVLGVAALEASAGTLSSLTVEGYFDNNEVPEARVAGAGETVEIPFAGSWFDSGSCALYVDDVLVAESDGAERTYALSGVEGAHESHQLVLKSADGVWRKVITLFPYEGYCCLLSSLETGNRRIDARPAGTLRRLKTEEQVDIAWSGIWNDLADRAVVKLYRGSGTDGEHLGDLVVQDGRVEGDLPFGSYLSSLPLGRYTLTHFDGVETLQAEIEICGGGVVLLLR